MLPSVSIIVCTYNRAASLQETLRPLGDVVVPHGWRVELIVVDNGSTDRTPQVIQNARLSNLPLRCVFEAQRGLCYARNTGIAAAGGEAILFTDDDVVPTNDWLERMATPLLERQCDAVVGKIEMAAHLRRPWMTPRHEQWLATLDEAPQQNPELVGASMGLHRSVFQRIPAFDPELGAGALGFGEETLFSLQLTQAGFRTEFVEQAVVVHHFDPSRLLRSEWLRAARGRGQLQAYLLHHWEHGRLNFPRLRWLWLAAKLSIRRIMQPRRSASGEGCLLWEISYVSEMSKYRQILHERRRPRNYAKRGLVKLNGPGAGLCTSPSPGPTPGHEV
jgi:GT2 family glycosyltransferase